MKKYLLLFSASFIFILSTKADFGSFASAVYINVNGSSQFYNTQSNGASTIGSVNFSGSLGSFTANTNSLTLRGAEVKTFKEPGSNVCGAQLFYTFYPKGNRPGIVAFNAISLNFSCNCDNLTFNNCGGGGCTNDRDQKWQTNNQSIDLTQLSPGDYTLEVYYQIPGSASSTSDCGDSRFDSNFGNNYTVDFTILENLAVNFSGLSATQNANNVQLKWSIENDVDIQRYEIQRSSDGINFNTLETVASVKSILKYNYASQDKAPLIGNSFYRIKFYGADNTISYSQILKINRSANGNSLQIAYNQSAGNLFIKPNNLNKGKYDISIINYIGQQLQHQSIIYYGIENNIQIDLPKKLPAGAYRILLQNKEQAYKGSFLIK